MNRTNFFLSLFAIAAFACDSSESNQETQNSVEISYELDTVMVDAGDEFIHVQWNLTSSGLSPDGKYLYNFKTGANDPGLEVLDLDELKLDHVIPMSLEGPNSIRHPYITTVYFKPDGTYFLSNNYDLYLFDQEGNKLSAFSYDNNEFEGEEFPADTRISLNETVSKDGKKIVTFYSDSKLEFPPIGIAVFDLENKSYRYKPVPKLKEMEKYRTNFYFNGNPAGAMFASFYLKTINDSLIISNSGINQLSFYDLKTDSLTSRTYYSQFTSQEITTEFPERLESQEAYRELYQETLKEVLYGSLNYDKENRVFWRFTRDMDHMKGDSVVFKSVLTAFDRQYNQLGETLLPEGFEFPFKPFIKDGMIWMFLNIDDEVAFVRLKPTISNE